MINTFLKAKHWQLFLLVFGLPFIIYIGWMISFFTEFLSDLDYNTDTDFPVEMLNGMITIIFLMMIPAAIQYAWFWSMASRTAEETSGRYENESKHVQDLFHYSDSLPLDIHALHGYIFWEY